MLLSWFQKRMFPNATQIGRRDSSRVCRQSRTRLCLEALEDRLVPATIFTQITTTTNVSFTNLAMSADGGRIAFVSNYNPTSIANPGGTNADGNNELFLADTTTSPATITQLT